MVRFIFCWYFLNGSNNCSQWDCIKKPHCPNVSFRNSCRTQCLLVGLFTIFSCSLFGRFKTGPKDALYLEGGSRGRAQVCMIAEWSGPFYISKLKSRYIWEGCKCCISFFNLSIPGSSKCVKFVPFQLSPGKKNYYKRQKILHIWKIQVYLGYTLPKVSKITSFSMSVVAKVIDWLLLGQAIT